MSSQTRGLRFIHEIKIEESFYNYILLYLSAYFLMAIRAAEKVLESLIKKLRKNYKLM